MRLESDKDLEDARHLRNVFAGQIGETIVENIKTLIKQYRLHESK